MISRRPRDDPCGGIEDHPVRQFREIEAVVDGFDLRRIQDALPDSELIDPPIEEPHVNGGVGLASVLGPDGSLLVVRCEREGTLVADIKHAVDVEFQVL